MFISINDARYFGASSQRDLGYETNNGKYLADDEEL